MIVFVVLWLAITVALGLFLVVVASVMERSTQRQIQRDLVAEELEGLRLWWDWRYPNLCDRSKTE
jgi:hypothetical protein